VTVSAVRAGRAPGGWWLALFGPLALVAGALVPVRPGYGLALALAALVLVLVAVRVDALPIFLVGTMFVESLSLGGGASIGRVAAVLALVVVGVHVYRHGTAGLRPSWLLTLALAYGLLLLVSAVWATSSGTVARTLGQYVLGAAYMLAFAVLVRTPAQLRAVLAAFVVGSVVFGLYGIATYSSAQGGAVGLQGDHNFFAMYEVIALPAALGLAAIERRPAYRRLAMLAVGVIVVSVVASLSRGGLIALAAVVLASLLMPRGTIFAHGRDRAIYAAGLAVAAVVALAVGSGAFVRRAESILSTKLSDRGAGRLDLWAAALHGWREHPWLGLGAGNFQTHALDLLATTPGVNTAASYVAQGRVVHSIYIETLAELGIVGLTLFLVLLAATAGSLAGSYRRAQRAGEVDLARMVVALLLALLAFLVAGAFLSAEFSKPLWILIGLALALEVMTRRRPA
jgi:O-antigen ligase